LPGDQLRCERPDWNLSRHVLGGSDGERSLDIARVPCDVAEGKCGEVDLRDGQQLAIDLDREVLEQVFAGLLIICAR
jgi:hypothetical protein